ncbi:acyl-ACP--UDP-N-acetylglucosamine O-acyltransferase [Nitrosospira sp. NRS527]|uniref:acyl-ACP--UDP-N-acetylglucosamine O-acyltransferase n=1 Tax=Nitrosospira sp. NRS527 TaxID=155925 RepID=UPI001BD13166|nr:acyl-ACP--UDP-N-acetylglucosamine O-acyltransferase [Nitrosospira sp. NRS527]
MKENLIHPAAIVHPGAHLGSGVAVGAYSIIGEHVEIGDNTQIGPHVVIKGHTRIGCDNRVFQFCSLGDEPQDKKYSGEPTRLEIGDRNTIRECCTFNRGTSHGAGITRLGNDNFLMAYVHLAHDCQVGNFTTFVNNASLAGHVQVGDYAGLGGFTAVHQFVRIGAYSFTALGTILTQDLPPYVLAAGNTARPHGLNLRELKRRGFSTEVIHALKHAYRLVYRSGLSLSEAEARIMPLAPGASEVRNFLDFLSVRGRGIIR